MPSVARFSVIAASAALAAACAHTGSQEPAKAGEQGVAPVNASVTITEDGAGGYAFAYDAPYFDKKGNFDFSLPGALHNRIVLTFTIADGSAQGVRFKTDARDAIWIVEKANVDPATGSPSGPYRGDQFFGFEVSKDGRRLTLTDENNDGVLYRYGLRFDRGGETVFDDPDGQNGGHR